MEHESEEFLKAILASLKDEHKRVRIECAYKAPVPIMTLPSELLETIVVLSKNVAACACVSLIFSSTVRAMREGGILPEIGDYEQFKAAVKREDTVWVKKICKEIKYQKFNDFIDAFNLDLCHDRSFECALTSNRALFCIVFKAFCFKTRSDGGETLRSALCYLYLTQFCC
jgi:hypothetical protein